MLSFFVSDLHGSIHRYDRLFEAIGEAKPGVVFIGGDIMPGLEFIYSSDFGGTGFIDSYLRPRLKRLREKLGSAYPRIFIILGNDDGKYLELTMFSMGVEGLWEYIQGRRVMIGEYSVYGYAYSPPSPFQLKDWERYDVSRYVDPGCVSPEEGKHSVAVPENELKYSTIREDLVKLTRGDDLSKSIILFHTPPYKTNLDRAALDGKSIDHIPLEPNVGSIAVRQFIETHQPYLTLHGHIHESPRLSGNWKDRIGSTLMFSAAHDGVELALIEFDLENLGSAVRKLL